jgi:hypothetical protein
MNTKLARFESYDARDVVSFDFDGVLHRSVVPGTTHPINFDQPDTWEPFEMMHAAVRKEHGMGNKVIVVTARDNYMKPYLMQFIKKYDLPIEEIECTDDEPKLPYIVASNSIRHYDDAAVLKNGLKKHGIQFYLVDPIKQNLKKVA